MSPASLNRFKKKMPRWAKHSMTVLYVAPDGCMHSCLPFFVDSLGFCHVSLDDCTPTHQPHLQVDVQTSGAHGSACSPHEPSDVDVYIDEQLAEMREMEGRRTAMSCILEEIIIRSKESEFLQSKMQEEEEHRKMMQPVLKEAMAAAAERERRMEEKRRVKNLMSESVLKDMKKCVKGRKQAKRKAKAAMSTKDVSPAKERENLMRELFGDGQEAVSSKASQAKAPPAPCAFSPREKSRRPKLHHFQLQQPKVVY